MKKQELNNLSREELLRLLATTQNNHYALEQAVRSGQDKKVHRVRLSRRAIARLKTRLASLPQ